MIYCTCTGRSTTDDTHLVHFIHRFTHQMLVEHVQCPEAALLMSC